MKRLRRILIIIVFLAVVVIMVLLNQKQVATEANGWNLILVNEDYYIPEDYKVTLVKLDNGERVDERICPALLEMFEEAEKDDVYMVVADGYRSHKEQEEVLKEKTKEYQKRVLIPWIAKMMAEKWVAIPGTSEHQLGIAVDINADAIHSSGQQVYQWLFNHAYEYGFIQRYPSDKSNITGINYEPWHYRYVGEDVAKEMFETDICLEEYLETHSQ